MRFQNEIRVSCVIKVEQPSEMKVPALHSLLELLVVVIKFKNGKQLSCLQQVIQVLCVYLTLSPDFLFFIPFLIVLDVVGRVESGT